MYISAEAHTDLAGSWCSLSLSLDGGVSSWGPGKGPQSCWPSLSGLAGAPQVSFHWPAAHGTSRHSLLWVLPGPFSLPMGGNGDRTGPATGTP